MRFSAINSSLSLFLALFQVHDKRVGYSWVILLKEEAINNFLSVFLDLFQVQDQGVDVSSLPVEQLLAVTQTENKI